MGYRGKLREQHEARELRAHGMILEDIAAQLGVAKSSVSLWVRDVPFTPSKRQYGPNRPNRLRDAKLAEIAALDKAGVERIGTMSDEAFLVAGIALYAGEGAKRDGVVTFANTDPAMVMFFCTWFRRFFDLDESRFRVSVYLHEGLDLDAAEEFWSELTRVPRSRFLKPYRAVADPTIRRNKHEHGCAYVRYYSTTVHRTVMGLVRALLSAGAIPG